MPTYNGVSFSILYQPGDWRPGWTRSPNISVRNIPYANADNVQSAGQGNPTIRVTALVEDDADLATLQNSVGTTGRTLSDMWSTNYSNTRLVGFDNPRRQALREYWFVDLTFVREGS